MEKDRNLNHKRGYLNNEFIFFNLEDTQELKIESHYHDFDKIVVFIAGQVTYYIEGTAYQLKPWDVLLINRDTIHKPFIDIAVPYKRMVLWVRPSFLAQYDKNLLTCFEMAANQHHNLIRLTPKMLTIIQSLLSQINSACKNQNFCDELLRTSLFLQFIIYLNRAALDIKKTAGLSDDMQHDDTIDAVLLYIDKNIAADLCIEQLAAAFFLSKYYLMRKFKQYTGYSIHQYILQKRLIRANQLMKSGQSVLTACLNSGFHDYSTFTRAFRKIYGLSPSKYQQLTKYEVDRKQTLPD